MSEPRPVLKYAGGAEVLDARENLIVRLPINAPTGLKTRLRREDWHRVDDFNWERTNNPTGVSSAITILRDFYGRPEGA